MRIPKLLLSVFVLLTLFLGAVNIVRGAEPTRTVKVGIYDNFPKIYQDADGKASGVFADILNYIAAKENWNLEYVPGLWEEGLTRLKNGKIDIMVDVAVSSDRKKQFDFSNETVLNSWAVIYIQKDSFIDSVLGLEGKRISILKSSIYEKGESGIGQYLKSFGVNATLVDVDNYSDVLNYLDMGKVDAAIVSRVYSLANEKYYPNLKTTNLFLEPSELRFALTKDAKDNKYLIERLDYWVKKFREGYEGFYRKTLEEHGLLELIPQVQQKAKETPCWVLPGIFGIVIGLLISILARILFRYGGKVFKPLKDKIFSLFSRAGKNQG